jgi:hypothetical protein
MADLTITPGSVLTSTNSQNSTVTKTTRVCGAATLAAGDVVYLDPADLDDDANGKAKLADNNASQTTAKADGICLHPSSLGQPIQVASLDPGFIPGAVLTPGMLYVLSNTPGKVMPVTDMASGMFYTPLFLALDATKADLNVLPSGIQRS